ncbi:unnamed protein product [Lampetra fluviatilis]
MPPGQSSASPPELGELGELGDQEEELLHGTEDDSQEGLVIHVNVGGLKRTLRHAVLLRFPQTRLALLANCRRHSREAVLEMCDDYDAARDEFYFDRSPGLFRYVLNFYRTGKLHVMAEVCAHSFSQEIAYWGIHEFFIDSCCSYRYHERMEDYADRDSEEKSEESSEASSFEDMCLLQADAKRFEHQRCGQHRKRLWLLLENPGFSLSSKVFAATSLATVVISIITMCINSTPEFQLFDANGKELEDPTLMAVECFCIAWFTSEFLVRFLVTPNMRGFSQNPLNIIDFVSILPFYITLVVDSVLESGGELHNLGQVVQVLRLARIFRILKLARHSTGLRSLGTTLKHSYEEVGLLLLFLSVGLLLLFLSVGISIFSVLTYAVEKDDEGSELSDIPTCWWWATISMTTVGYGDTVPVTVPGKLMATACIMCGIIVVALPITIIFNKFTKYYRIQKAMEMGVSTCDGSEDDGDVDAEELHSRNLRDFYAAKVHSLVRLLPANTPVGGCNGSVAKDDCGAASAATSASLPSRQQHGAVKRPTAP